MTPSPTAAAQLCADFAQNASDPEFSLDEILDRCLGNLALVQKVLSRFLGGLEERVGELDRQVEESDERELARLAHRLRGEASNVGARGISQHARRVEELVTEGFRLEAQAAVGELIEACRGFQRQVPALLAAALTTQPTDVQPSASNHGVSYRCATTHEDPGR